MNTGKIYDHQKLYELNDFDGESWADIVGFEGIYMVSNLGRVKSLVRTVGSGKSINHRYNYEKIMTMGKTAKRRNYHKVDLYKDGKVYNKQVHRLVAIAFIPNPYNKRTVNHDFGDTFDNRASVLSWATDSEQNIHAYRTGLRRIGENHPNAKLSNKQILEIRQSKLKQVDLAKKYKVSSPYICILLKNKYRVHDG